MESLATTAFSTLWITAGVALLAGAAEVWRYVLLVRSRTEALPEITLAISDALVGTAGFLTWLFGIVCGIVVVLWALRARIVAAERIGARNERSDWELIAGVLVPGANLFLPGSIVAELEHATLVGEGERSLGTRPRPSRLVLAWWTAWAVSLLLGWTTLLWSFRNGVQALADGVILHAWNDVSIAILAVLTARLVDHLTYLLTPVAPNEVRQMRVVEVRDAPPPPRPQRPTSAPR